ncbi:hypothetical protein LTR36_010168 [Oleoguttula mirabilis]|uniref:Uncharacterized protein n=1 Tax=Oleoguttula mirabilis TaxID=1507867 RepID=A0AAV9JRR3_9PEZI|nr:hypothetical protein LTR36_010168 [Oleoguttula mirabilis]
MDAHYQDKNRTAAYKAFSKNERIAVKLYIKKFVDKDIKSQITAAEDRWQMLLKKREEKLQERVEQHKGTTETLFPDKYDQWDEHRYYRKAFESYLRSVGHGNVDQDDDEELGPGTPRIKSEIMHHLWEGDNETIAVKYGRPCKTKLDYEESEDEADGEGEDEADGEGEDEADGECEDETDGEREDEKPDKPVVGIACQRSYSIRFSCVGLEGLEAKMKVEASAEKASVVVGIAVTPGFARPKIPNKKRKCEDEGEHHSDAKKIKKE